MSFVEFWDGSGTTNLDRTRIGGAGCRTSTFEVGQKSVPVPAGAWCEGIETIVLGLGRSVPTQVVDTAGTANHFTSGKLDFSGDAQVDRAANLAAGTSVPFNPGCGTVLNPQSYFGLFGATPT